MWALGSRSEDGETRIARLLSAHTTCRLQGRSLFEYLADALDHHARGAPIRMPRGCGSARTDE
jgi:hypothetical protein